MTAPLVLLGATGSIGRQSLEVAHHLGMEVEAVAAGHWSARLLEVAKDHPEADVAVAAAPSEDVLEAVRAIPNDVSFGTDAVEALAARPGRTVLNGIVGSAGLTATLRGLKAGNRVALANKESLVAGGQLVMQALDQGGGELLPVDSEHSALFQCLEGEAEGSVERLVLTASGGPFRGMTADQLVDVTVDQALAHPTWSMGGRITVDSATLMNKGLEVIEAHHLFRVHLDAIEVVVHPQSIVHSAVEFVDGSLKAQVGAPDMRIPIQYALTYPERVHWPSDGFSLAGHSLQFEEVDRQTFPAVDLAFSAGRTGGTAPAILNAADEVAVAAFLQGRLAFTAIVEIVERTLARVASVPIGSIEDVLAADAEARRVGAEMVASAMSRA